MDTTSQKGGLIDPVAFAYDFGARMYDARIGHFVSVDPLQAKYPSISPYAYVANNPIIFVDQDGRQISPSGAFKKTSYYPVFNKLVAENSTFTKILGKYKTDVPTAKQSAKFTLTLDMNANNVPAGAAAFTQYSYSTDAKKNVLSSTSRIDFTNSYADNTNDLGKAALIVHEALHAYLGLQGVSTPKNDSKHNTWDNYFDLMEFAIQEYSNDNNLNLSSTQVTELSLFNARGSAKYDSYIKDLVTQNGSKFEDEEKLFLERMNGLVGKDANPQQSPEGKAPGEE